MSKKSLGEFRKPVYRSLRRRADVLFDLIDALTVASSLVADSRYEEHRFLGIFEHLHHTFGLIRLHSNRVLYEAPQQKPAGAVEHRTSMGCLSS